MAHRDPARKRANGQAYRAAHREKARERTAAWRLANPERAKLADKAKREAKPDLYREINKRGSRKHYEKNRDRVKERSLQWHSANRGKINEYDRRWRGRNPDKVHAYGARARAKRRGAPKVERFDRMEIYERDKGRCHICGRFVPRSGFHLDHLIPLSRGGAHSRGNVKVAHPICNLRKGVTLPAATK